MVSNLERRLRVIEQTPQFTNQAVVWRYTGETVAQAKRRYIESHPESAGGDFLFVGWQEPETDRAA